MLTAREQLMEDIDSIVDEYFQEYGITNDPELVRSCVLSAKLSYLR